jgi:hypothetical protein
VAQERVKIPHYNIKYSVGRIIDSQVMQASGAERGRPDQVMTLCSNFAYDEQFLRLGLLGERYFNEFTNTYMIKLRQLTEVLA